MMCNENIAADSAAAFTLGKNPQLVKPEVAPISMRGVDIRGKKTISNMFDDALKSVNDISDLVPSSSSALPTETRPVNNPQVNPMQFMSPFMMFNPAIKQTAPPSNSQYMPNEMLYMNMLAHLSQYQGLMQQFQQQQPAPVMPQLVQHAAPQSVVPPTMVAPSVVQKMDPRSYQDFTLGPQMGFAQKEITKVQQVVKSRYNTAQAEPQIETVPEVKPEIVREERNTIEATLPVAAPAIQTTSKTVVVENAEIPANNPPPTEPERKVRREIPRKSSVVDEVPIKHTNKTFEQLLEENLTSGPKPAQGRPSNLSKPKKPVEKKEFLKRKSSNIKPTVNAKKYTYFSDKVAEQQPGVFDGEGTKPMESAREEKKYSTAKKAGKSGSKFLAKGKGTGGGVGASGGRGTKPKAVKEKLPPLARNADEETAETPNNNNEALKKESDSVNNEPLVEEQVNDHDLAKGLNREELKDDGSNNENLDEYKEEDRDENEAIHTKEPEQVEAKQEENKKIVVETESEEAIHMRTSVAEFQKLEEECNKSKQSQRKIEEVSSNDTLEITDIKPKRDQKAAIKEFFSREESTSKEEPCEQNVEVKQRLKELSEEIDKLKKDRKRVEKQKMEYDKLFKKLQGDVTEFETYKEKEMANISELREKEQKKIAQEKRVLDRQNKAVQNMPNKKEKEEIESLKKETAKLHEDMKAKEGRNKVLIDKTKRQLDESLGKNKELEKLVNELKEQIIQLRSETSVVPDAKKSNKENSKPKPEKIERIEKPESPSPESEKKIQKAKVPKKAASKKIVESPKEVPTTSDPIAENDERSEQSEDDVGNEYDHSERKSIAADRNNNENDDNNNDNENDNVSERLHEAAVERAAASAEDDLKEKLREVSVPAEKGAENESEKYDMVFLQKYHAKNVKLVSQRVYNDGKISRQYENGKTELTFSNGVRKETFTDNYAVIYFNNQDIKQTYPDGKVVYYFAEAKTTQTTFSDGLQVFKFASVQIEKHYPDGTKEISFPDGTIKCIFADGEEESIFADGTVQRVEKSGIKAIEYPNGEKEITFPDGTLIKEFPDGRIRKTYPDGTYENTFVERTIPA